MTDDDSYSRNSKREQQINPDRPAATLSAPRKGQSVSLEKKRKKKQLAGAIGMQRRGVNLRNGTASDSANKLINYL